MTISYRFPYPQSVPVSSLLSSSVDAYDGGAPPCLMPALTQQAWWKSLECTVFSVWNRECSEVS